MRRCGTTANGCNGKTGKYRIDFVIPDASYVQYRYAGEGRKEIKDATRNLNYRIQKSSQPGQAQGVKYTISVYTRADLYFPSWPSDRFGGTFYPSFGYIGLNATTQFTGPITSVVIRRGDAFPGRYANSIWIQIVHGGQTDLFQCNATTQPKGQGTGRGASGSMYWKLPVPPPDYPILELTMKRVDNQPETDKWRFQVVDSSGNVIFSREADTQPSAVTIPEQYGQNKGIFRISNPDPNKLLRVVRAIEGDRKVVNVFLGDTLMQKLVSPIGANLYPKVCWDCDGDKKCPKGTCEVKCGDHTCCYDKRGISVYSYKS